MATLSEAPDWALALLESQPVGHLGLLDERGRPRVQPVTFALVGDALWSAVDDKPKRRRGEQLAPDRLADGRGGHPPPARRRACAGCARTPRAR